MDRNMIFGGNALGVLLRLAAISIVVGIVLMTLGITPNNLVESIVRIGRRIYDMGFGAIEWAVRPLILGAMVVVPVWLVARLFGFGRSSSNGDINGRHKR
jgi:Family of unknown function (DUF6460)